MRVGIVGYRNFNDYEKFKTFLLQIDLKITTIISGGCSGTDTLAEKYANESNIPIIIHYPEWNKYGKSAGPIRNKKIVDDSEFIIAFVSSNSKGTFDTIKKAKEKSIPIQIFYI